MRILVITKNVPWPANSGEKLRTLGIVRALRGLGEVTVVGLASAYDDPALAAADDVSVTWVDQQAPRPQTWAWRALRARSITAGRWWSPELAAAVRHEVGRGVDVVVVEHVQLVGLLPDLPARTVRVLDMHNVESALTARLGRTSTSWRRWVYRAEAVALRRLEVRSVPAFDLVCVVSAADRDALARVVAAAPVLVPNAIETGSAAVTPAATPTAVFVGLMSWAPNAEAAVWFAREVWPRVRERVAGARLLVVGRDPGAQVLELAADDVEVTGSVASLEPYYARARVALAPLLAGGGSRLKILEALAAGRPVVATVVGAEGLEDLRGRGVVTSPDAAAMADDVVRLLDDPDLAHELGTTGANAVRADHSWPAATAPLVRYLETHR